MRVLRGAMQVSPGKTLSTARKTSLNRSPARIYVTFLSSLLKPSAKTNAIASSMVMF